jgi:putative ABC transport system substrate-binding protein
MDRRAFLAIAIGGPLASREIADADAADRVFRVAMLGVNDPFPGVFLQRLRALGYRQGDNLVFETPAEGASIPFDRYPAIAAEIASRHPDVIVAAGSRFVIDALRAAAAHTPVVMIFIDFDPIATGQVATLARPGGSVTGMSVQQTDIAGKKVELLHEAAPTARRIGVLFDAATREQLDAAQPAAHNLGLTLLPQELSGTIYDYDGALRASIAAGAKAALVLSSGRFFPDRFVIVEQLQKYRLPALTTTAFADAGALLCFSVNFPEVYVRAAEYTDRILKGQKPGDLPVEQPTRLKLTINLKTAKALGLTIPPSLLQRADQVIE